MPQDGRWAQDKDRACRGAAERRSSPGEAAGVSGGHKCRETGPEPVRELAGHPVPRRSGEPRCEGGDCEVLSAKRAVASV